MLISGVSLANAFANYFNTLFSNGWVDIYAGTPPAHADDATGDTLLSSIHLPLIAFAASSNGTIVMQGTWFATVAASGTAAWFRFRDPTDTIHLMGSVTNTGGAGPLKLSTLALVYEGVVQATAFSLTVGVGS